MLMTQHTTLFRTGFAAIVLSTSGLITACSKGDSESANSAESNLITDAVSMQQLPNGDWVVVCKDGTTETVTSQQILANAVCEGASVPVTCIPRASDRWSDGSIKTLAPDHCAKRPSCAPKAKARWSSDASVKTWDVDHCVAGGQATCVPRALGRWADGKVKDYDEDYCSAAATVKCIPRGSGPDLCGASPSCATKCLDRWSNGTCRTQGEDFCKESGPPAKCEEQCVARWSDGSCRTYGPDTCS